MENLLDLYAQPYNPLRPVVCIDETAKELFEAVQADIPMQKGEPRRQDCEYVRNGRRDLFVAIEPLRGWRYVQVTERRTAYEYAHFIKDLVDGEYAEAEEIQVAQDNLNTHGAASLYKVFEPAEARRILRKVRFHYTPKHGSWLNMAEIEIGIIKRECLNRRIGTAEYMASEVAALVEERNRAGAKIKWQFSCEKARTTLHRLYPKLTQTQELPALGNKT